MNTDAPQPTNALLRDLLHLAQEADALEISSDATVQALRTMRGLRTTWFDTELGLRRSIDEYLQTKETI